MGILVSHPTGNANLRAVLRATERSGTLSEFWTTLCLPPALIGAKVMPEQIRRKLSQRSFSEAPWDKTRVRPIREIARLGARGAGWAALIRHETGWASVDGVYRGLDRAVAQSLRKHNTARVVYAYEDGARDSFRAARDTGRFCVYDLPIAHWRTLRRLLEEEAERLPEWACTMEGLRDSAEKHARKDEEITLADHVLVASSFTLSSLTDQFGAVPATVVPYGCPPPTTASLSERAAGEPLRLLFAGHLAQRKGIADLIAAVALLDIDWTLTLVGPKPAHTPAALDAFLESPRVHWLGTVPHATLLERMAEAHAFVFPSIVEGFGMVITEALSAGLPVITTPHTAGPDILTEGEDGFIVPIRNPAALAERITRLHDDEVMRQAMAAAARRTAASRSWTGYEDRIGTLAQDWCARL